MLCADRLSLCAVSMVLIDSIVFNIWHFPMLDVMLMSGYYRLQQGCSLQALLQGSAE